MPTYRFLTADIFTSRRFGGNQLAVIPEAKGLTDAQMLAITREFNYSESTFVLPPETPEQTCRVRIFTPAGELPFAGHPTVGTAFVLAATGAVRLTGDETRIVLGENVGPVPVVIRSRDGRPGFAQFSVAKLPEVGPALPPNALLAEVLGLEEGDLLTGDSGPEVVSCGVPFTFVPLRSRDAVRRAKLRLDAWERVISRHPGHMLFFFARDAEEPGHDIRARMFGPGVSVAEDPATGSACAALGGYLGSRDPLADGTLRWVVEQGYEMGRPSQVHIETDKRGGQITAVRVGGESVLVCEGTIQV
jgi:trans-2,3-dihydro-3-hydroxyanthranilate isomerase